MGVRFDDYKHVVRVGLLFLAGLVVFLIVRAAMMPEGFGKYGHYRAGAIDDVRMLPIRHAGQAACAECHTDVIETRAGGRHRRLSCEGCHGPLASHAADPGAANATKPDPRAICIRCHASNRSRPSFIPQVVVSEHADEGACTACHAPHKPGVS